jgi:hypothetical protein
MITFASKVRGDLQSDYAFDVSPKTTASCESSSGPIQTLVPPPADSSHPPTPPAEPLRRVPPSSCLSMSMSNFVRHPQENLLIRETSIWRGGLPLLRHVSSLTRSHVVYFGPGAYKQQQISQPNIHIYLQCTLFSYNHACK